jgi:hypothetical protein
VTAIAKKQLKKKHVKCDYSVVATADVLRLQKNPVAKTSMCVIATLSHVRDCKFYRSVIAKQVKVRLRKKAPCRRKKEGAKNIAEFQFTNSKKKGRKVAHITGESIFRLPRITCRVQPR